MYLKKNRPLKIQVKKSHYFNLKYDSKKRWISYWYQISEVLNAKPNRVLEVGVGNKVVSDYLKKIGISTITCDFDAALKPDYAGNVLELPFKKDSFDTVLCAEVLEHIPFEDFGKALKELKKVTKNKIILTLPHYSLTNIYFGFKLIPFLPIKELSVKVDFPFKHVFTGEHYWEIGKRSYPLSSILSGIKKVGLTIEKQYYPKENPYHHFFILSKKKEKIK